VSGLYYPSLVVNLTLRFEEALTSVTYQPGSTPRVGEDPKADVAGAASKDELTQLIGLTPREASVELPGYRQAGKFSFALAYRDLPIDPRALRAVKAEVHLGTVSAEDFGRGMNYAGDGPRPSVIATRADGAVREDTLLLYGLADEVSVEHGAEGSEIRFEGRDLRGLLLDLQLSAASLDKVKLDKPIDDVVRQICREHKLLKAEMDAKPPRLTIEVVKDDWPSGVPKVAAVDDLTRVNKGAKGDKATMPSRGESDKLNYWDIITQFCFLVGAIPYFKGSKLLIRRARNLYEQTKDDAPSPFKGQRKRELKSPDGRVIDTVNWRRMVYGADVLSFKMDRKLAGVKVPTVEIVSMDTAASSKDRKGRMLTVRWPEEKKSTNVAAEGDAAQEDFLRFPIAGIKNKDRLLEIAKNLYEEVGRGELNGGVSTRDLASFGGNNQDPDLLALRPGDMVELVTSTTATLGSRPAVVSEWMSHISRSEEEEVAEVAARLGSKSLARIVVKTARGKIPELQRFFRVANVKFSWGADKGVALDFDFHNYVEVRADPERK